MTERVLAPKNGIVIKQAKQRAERMYRKYAKQAGSEALNRKDWDELLIRYAKYLNFARKSQILSVLDQDEWLRRNRMVANFDREIRVSQRHPLLQNLSTILKLLKTIITYR